MIRLFASQSECAQHRETTAVEATAWGWRWAWAWAALALEKSQAGRRAVVRGAREWAWALSHRVSGWRPRPSAWRGAGWEGASRRRRVRASRWGGAVRWEWESRWGG